MQRSNNQCVFFGKVFEYDNLKCLILSLDLNEKKDRSVKSNFHWQKLKSRILIFSKDNILVSPALDSLQLIYLIAHKNFYNEGNLKEILAKNNFKKYKEQRVSCEIFEACLRYTLIARLAPKWNLVGRFLIEGRNFLTNNGHLNAVQYDISKDGKDQVVIKVCAYKVKLYKVTAEDFEEYTNFSKMNNDLYDLSHCNYRLNVLPSMKNGKVISISKKFPDNSCFQDYKELRRHWKNVYGFRLPEKPDNMFYVNINFFGPIIFTYPILCVRSGMSSFPIGDEKYYSELVTRFIADINNVIPRVCDMPFKIKDKFGIPVNELLKMKSDSELDNVNLAIKDLYFRLPSKVIPEENFEKNYDHPQEETDDSQNEESTQLVSLCTPTQLLQKSIHSTKTTEPRFIPSFARKSTNLTLEPNKEIVNILAESTSTKRELFDGESFQSMMERIKPTFSQPKKVAMFQILQKNRSNNLVQIKQQELGEANQSRAITQKNYKLPDKKQSDKFSELAKPKSTKNTKKKEAEEDKVNKKQRKEKNYDIRKMAQSGTLTKASVSSLTEYLREQNISFKSKDKKCDLINKILNSIK